MSRGLHVLNLAGVIALAVLCAFQWGQHRAVHLELHALEKARHELDARLKEREQAVQACAADLDGFRQQIVEAKAALAQTEQRSTLAARVVDRATQESGALKRRAAEWRDAVAERDERLQALQAQLRETAADRNGMVKRYNTVVETLNDRTRQLDALAKACRATSGDARGPGASRGSAAP
jgi:chromosome segregation ATPase